MIQDFSKEELETRASEHEIELTLGFGTLLVLACVLLGLCGVCFGLGYTVGHRSSANQTALTEAQEPISGAATAPTGSGAKPGAAGAAPIQRQPIANQPDDPTRDTSNAAETAPAPASQGSRQPEVKPALEAQVRPALGPQAATGQPAAALKVQPASARVQGWMVQIAAISQPEDAEVLVSALRKHGYEVTARRDLGDSLIHVQTGPFASRNDANAMRQKLLNDGYNAIVQ